MRLVKGWVLLIWALTVRAQTFALDIPAQPLDSALERLSAVTGLQFVYPSQIVAGLRSPAVRGEYGAEAALAHLLADSGLAYRYVAADTVALEPAQEQEQEDVRTIGIVRVAGTRTGPPRGVNGSSDALATENSGRYAPRGAGVGSPYPQALKETPRSLSVLGLPQMQDQNIVELSDALRQLPSVAVEGYASESLAASVRGRPLEYYQFDGGAVLPFLNNRIAGDLSAYDRIELLNGADGLGNGFVPPSGTLNLVRKRPLDHAQLVVQAQAGSWDHYRGMLDANAPPAWDGRLRGRTVLAGLDRDLFYDGGFQRRQSYYGVAEADLSPDTLLRVGGQYMEQRGSPWELGGMPRFASGEIVPRERESSFLLPWHYEDIRSRHAFANLEQSFSPRWRARLAVDHLQEEREALVSELFGEADPETGFGLFLASVLRETRNEYTLADFGVNGRFDWLGREHVVSLGFNHAEHDLREDYIFPVDFVPLDVFDFDPADYPRPEINREDLAELQNERVKRYGASLALTLNPSDALDLIAAWRWSTWTSQVRAEPVWPDLPPRSRTRKHGPSYFGATWALSGRWNLYASWADAYLVNNGLLRPDGSTPAPTVGDNYEAGVKYASADDGLQARLTLYRSERSNFPRQLEANPESVFCCYDNGGGDRDRIQGVESEITGAPAPGWRLAAGYTYADLEYRYSPSPAGLDDASNRGATVDSRTPRHALRLWAVWEPAVASAPGLRFGAGLRAQSRSLMEIDNLEGFTEGPRRQDAYAVLDAMAGWRFHPRWEAALNARNLFDREYYQAVTATTGNLYGEPRSVALSLRGSF